MNPEELLYSTPTINAEIPTTLGAKKAGPETFRTHEDNWRQFEFLSAKHLPVIEEEAKQIAEIWKSHSVDAGKFKAFRSLHVRERIPTAIGIHFSAQDLEQLLGEKAGTWLFGLF